MWPSNSRTKTAWSRSLQPNSGSPQKSYKRSRRTTRTWRRTKCRNTMSNSWWNRSKEWNKNSSSNWGRRSRNRPHNSIVRSRSTRANWACRRHSWQKLRPWDRDSEMWHRHTRMKWTNSKLSKRIATSNYSHRWSKLPLRIACSPKCRKRCSKIWRTK